MTERDNKDEPKNRALDNPIIRAAIDHFQPREIRYTDVPEWRDPDGKPYRIYYFPWTLKDRSWLIKRSSEDNIGLEAYADLIIRKACDANGNRLFALDARSILLDQVDPAVLVALGNQITKSRSIEDYVKN